MSSKKLSVLIVTYGGVVCLKKCTDSLYEKFKDLFEWEIVIINNDENQNISRLSLNFSKINVLNNGKNVGFGAGMNLGAKQAVGEYLLILNPDTEILTDNVQEVFSEFEKNENIGVIGAGIFENNQQKQPWSAGFEMSLYNLLRNNLGWSRSRRIWESEREIKCDWVAGTGMFVKRNFFKKIGGFDENFFMYFEDMDFCKRTRNDGKEVVFFPDFQVSHSGGKSYNNNKKLQKKHYYDSLELYFKKNRNYFEYHAIKIARRLFHG